MNDYQKIAQWILSDLHYNAPIYTDLCKKVIPLYGNITSEDIHYRIEREDLTSGGRKFNNDTREPESSTMLPNEYLHIFVTDKCYRPEHKHILETLITAIKTDKIQPSTYHYHLIPNNLYFNFSSSSPYDSTIFNYLYVMKHVRELKLVQLLGSDNSQVNLLLSSSSSKDDVKNDIKKNSPEY